ncbi:hypothetical protein C8R47DRAFT_1083502 [Mycena vitilis]|nr:hypothetical protein C8R47DRAFT_1083502 [Mycena vitilis]
MFRYKPPTSQRSLSFPPLSQSSMISTSSHPSSASVNSATGLTATARPPQKDYAAAYAALQDKYGPAGYGQLAPANAPKPGETSGASKSAPPPRSASSAEAHEGSSASSGLGRVRAALVRLRSTLVSGSGLKGIVPVVFLLLHNLT